MMLTQKCELVSWLVTVKILYHSLSFAPFCVSHNSYWSIEAVSQCCPVRQIKVQSTSFDHVLCAEKGIVSPMIMSGVFKSWLFLGV